MLVEPDVPLSKFPSSLVENVAQGAAEVGAGVAAADRRDGKDPAAPAVPGAAAGGCCRRCRCCCRPAPAGGGGGRLDARASEPGGDAERPGDAERQSDYGQ